MEKRNQLSELNIFRNVAPETLEQLEKLSKIVSYPKGTVLMRAKEPTGFVYFQLSGKSMMYNLTHHGKRKILFIFGAGVMLNENVFNNHTTSVYCETIDKSKIMAVPVAEFTKLMAADFNLTQNVLEAQERKLWRLTHQLKNTLSSIYMEQKLAAKIWKLSRDFGVQTDEGVEIDINLTITFLADMLGAPRETTSRVCSILVENGLIKMKKKRIVILDMDKLSSFYKTGKIK